MTIKLFGSPMSTCTRRVAAAFKEKNVPFEFHAVDFTKKEHKSEEYLKKQPFGQVPFIDDDGFVLFESRAIARYIALKYRDQGNKIIPDASDIKATALFEQAASIEGSNFDPYASGIAAEKRFKPNRGIPTNEAVVESYLATLNGKLDAYDAILSKQKYIAGDEFTLVDLFHLPYGTLLGELKYDVLENAEKRPNVARWWKDITSRPSWQAVKGGVASSSE